MARLKRISILLLFANPLSHALADVREGIPSAVTDKDYLGSGATSLQKVALGRDLFFDKILSGNKNISCATCHHPFTGTSDGLPLPIGEGGRGMGVTRTHSEGGSQSLEKVPRNSPAIFNLGAKEFVTLFHDGRVAIDMRFASGYLSPMGNELPHGLDNVLAVQAMFPPTSAIEMAGQPGENTIADEARRGNIAGENGVWDQLSERIRRIPEYVNQFTASFNDVRKASDITFVHVANAIAAFELVAGRADNSPFDRYLRGERSALSVSAQRGMRLFYGRAGCSKCHSGKFQTDHAFHAIAVPQLGPGKGDNQAGYFDGADDFGRERVTANPRDRYAFRTPSLRNVALTAPYGHDGAYSRLSDMVNHHLDPVNALYDYEVHSAGKLDRREFTESDLVVLRDAARLDDIARQNELDPVSLKKEHVIDILSFLHALTDTNYDRLLKFVPKKVPSGLPVYD